MKQIQCLFTAILFCCFFSTKSFGQLPTLTVDPNLINQNMEVGFPDSVTSFRFSTDSSGFTITELRIRKKLSSTLPDNKLDSIKLYKKPAVHIATVIVTSTGITTVPVTITMTAHDTVYFVGLSRIDTTTIFGQTVQLEMSVLGTDTGGALQLVPSTGFTAGQTMTSNGGYVSCTPDPTFINQHVTPGTHRQIGSFYVQGVGYANHIFWDTLNNLGSVDDSFITNVTIDTTSTMGSIMMMGPGAIIAVNQSLPSGTPVLCKVFADLSSSIPDTATIKLVMRPFAGYSPTTGQLIPTGLAVGNSVTVDNPPTGPITMTLSELPTANYVMVGFTECFFKLNVATTGAILTIDSIKVEDTGSVDDSASVGPANLNKASTIMSIVNHLHFTQTFTNLGTVPVGNTLFTLNGTLLPASILDTGHYFNFFVTVYAHDGSTQFVQTLSMVPDQIILEPTGVKDVKEDLLSVYPTATTNFLNVDGLQKEQKYQIIAMNGKVTSDGFVSKSQNTIDVRNLPMGNYILTLNDGKTTKQVKFTKQ